MPIKNRFEAMTQGKKRCFVIMPISDTGGYEKGHFNRVYEHLIKPACEQADFEPIRADDTSKANMIMVDILQKILECDMAICDLSSRNPNVFYELGFRQAFNKKTVLIKDRKTDMPFDISGIRTLSYNENLRIDEVKKTVFEIAKCITETFEANNNEINPLLQLLSIERPAILPEKVILSQDSSLILNAIGELNKRLDLVNSSTSRNTYSSTTSNGEVLTVGQEIFIQDPNTNTKKLLGNFIGENENFLFIKDDNEHIITIDKNEK